MILTRGTMSGRALSLEKNEYSTVFHKSDPHKTHNDDNTTKTPPRPAPPQPQQQQQQQQQYATKQQSMHHKMRLVISNRRTRSNRTGEEDGQQQHHHQQQQQQWAGKSWGIRSLAPVVLWISFLSTSVWTVFETSLTVRELWLSTTIQETIDDPTMPGGRATDDVERATSGEAIHDPTMTTGVATTNTTDPVPSYGFDPSSITTVYHLGRGHPYERTGNQLLTIWHAVDMAFDRHGDPPNCQAVVAVSGWAESILKRLLVGKTGDASDVTTGIDDSHILAMMLEDRIQPLILVSANRLEELQLTGEHNNKTEIDLDAKKMFFYMRDNWNNLGYDPSLVESRRKLVLGNLFKMVSKSNLIGYDGVQNYLASRMTSEQKQTQLEHQQMVQQQDHIKYAVIHSRWLEGHCERRAGIFAQTDCWMPPDYIKAILGPKLIHEDRIPIMYISDGQNKEVLYRLQNDTDLGPLIVLPNINNSTLPPGVDADSMEQPFNDFMLAIKSDIFIGSRQSTMAVTIGQARHLGGADPKSNFIYVGEQHQEGTNLSTAEEMKVCTSCLFLCFRNKSNMCGGLINYH